MKCGINNLKLALFGINALCLNLCKECIESFVTDFDKKSLCFCFIGIHKGNCLEVCYGINECDNLIRILGNKLAAL